MNTAPPYFTPEGSVRFDQTHAANEFWNLHHGISVLLKTVQPMLSTTIPQNFMSKPSLDIFETQTPQINLASMALKLQTMLLTLSDFQCNVIFNTSHWATESAKVFFQYDPQLPTTPNTSSALQVRASPPSE